MELAQPFTKANDKLKGKIMGHLTGLKAYLDEAYDQSVFDQALASQQPWELHLHGHRIVKARIIENVTYDVKIDIEGQGIEELPKIQVKLLYPVELSETVRGFIKLDKKVHTLDLPPIPAPHERHFIKNKTLFPLMQERQVLFLTLLEGEAIRGLVAGFTRYDLTINLKGGTPVVILRHSIYDARNKQGRCLLKSFQDKHKDWQKSALFVS